MTVAEELERDVAMLEAAEASHRPSFRTWHATVHTVVLGRGGHVEKEVNVDFCNRKGIPVLRRASGGGAVVIGPGTLQYAFALPYSLSPRLDSIEGAKRCCNHLLLHALVRGDCLESDATGDLRLGAHKVGGLALKRRRHAVLVHGTLLLAADIDLIARILLHPRREPAYRAGREHKEFLANLGPIDAPALENRVRHLLATLGTFPADQ